MEFKHEFTIPVGIEEALDVLTDLERVAPCMPGATLEEVDGDTYTGRVKVKVGPMSLTYRGDATVTDVDREAHTARIEAEGREKRGAGTASADVEADLEEVADGTRVAVTTDINITGKPAQFGRGVMADVGGKIIERFADNLRDMLQEEQAVDEVEATTDVEVEQGADAGTDAAAATMPASAPAEPSGSTDADVPPPPVDGTQAGGPAAAAAAGAGAAAASADTGTSGSSSGPRRVQEVAPRDDALDLMDVAGEATAKRAAPVAAGAALLLLLIVLLRRRNR